MQGFPYAPHTTVGGIQLWVHAPSKVPATCTSPFCAKKKGRLGPAQYVNPILVCVYVCLYVVFLFFFYSMAILCPHLTPCYSLLQTLICARLRAKDHTNIIPYVSVWQHLQFLFNQVEETGKMLFCRPRFLPTWAEWNKNRRRTSLIFVPLLQRPRWQIIIGFIFSFWLNRNPVVSVFSSGHNKMFKQEYLHIKKSCIRKIGLQFAFPPKAQHYIRIAVIENISGLLTDIQFIWCPDLSDTI